MTIRAEGKHIGKAVSLAEHVKRSTKARQTVAVAAITEKGQTASMTITLSPADEKAK